jgi:hypothetical protein
LTSGLICWREEGLPYIRQFLEENEGDETLKEAVEEARRIINAAEAPPAPTP